MKNEQVRQTKVDMLIREYELFTMEKDEEIDDMFERLSTIVNSLEILGKSYLDEKLVRKVLRSCTKPLLSKVSTRVSLSHGYQKFQPPKKAKTSVCYSMIS